MKPATASSSAGEALFDHDEDDSLHIGGRGLSIAYQLRGEAILSAGSTRNRMPVWGARDGKEGGTNALSIARMVGGKETFGLASGIVLKPVDIVRILTANGGGWGRPAGV